MLEFRAHEALDDGITAKQLMELYTTVKAKGAQGDKAAWDQLRGYVQVPKRDEYTQ